ncbi:retinol dehydrogenase 11 [Tribolium castaneum]|uniref:WW domain-containing oxidoreductase-like Protein n=1 Tax=Tribolium castaneum TaxID=7070 RepID=A0A139WD13_TRICA|nr:PREDICTED: retinol dehydrogenase 11-like [Tribolium castaneum]KYB25858.1 WW domain-containing oxidoreductase-like Protein [Tribolium castaneum]|eukprot:XP_015838250.1 PREDICTED: retinol dehydrogenase 11-like [Tribolium castaneum]
MANFLLTIVLPVFVISVLVKIYLKLIAGWCKCKTCLVGKTVIVTGPTSGMGYETALDFAQRGARVILGCLDKREGEETKLKIINETGNANIIVKPLDMASFDSVRAFARDVNASEDHLDILVNNAGVAGIGDRLTQDGHLYTMQVNYFSAFLLTNLLLGLLKKTKNSRIVNVASVVAKYEYHLDCTRLDHYPGNYQKVYSRSKLCLLLFTIELAKRLQSTTVTIYSVHPGVVSTHLFENVHGFGKYLVALGRVFFKTSEEGAQTIIHCAVSKGIEGDSGGHFVDCRKVPRYETAKDGALMEKLWVVSEEIVHLRPEEVVI